MTHKPTLRPGGVYHIYNRALNKDNLFTHEHDFEHFLHLMEAYLTPVAEVWSYALMINHFHFAIRIKRDEEIGWLIPENAKSGDARIKWKTTDHPHSPDTQKPRADFMIRHLFDAYSKWYNIRYQRRGKLFEERHERKPIEDDNYLRQLIAYINRNPEHHGVVAEFHEYPWISYHDLIAPVDTWLARGKVMSLFGGQAAFFVAMERKENYDWLLKLE